MHYRKKASDIIFEVIVAILVTLLLVFTLYPLIYVISMSISDPVAVVQGKILFLPKGFSLRAMNTVNNKDIYRYYYNTLWYVTVGTVMGLLTTSLAAYPLSRKEFKARGVLMKIITFTMFFGGGLIPSYITITKFLHLYDSRWALILPAASPCSMILGRTPVSPKWRPS